MAKRDVLTAKEQLFVAAYVACGFNGKAAAIQVGHPPKGAAVAAVRYLERAKVQQAIARYVEEKTRDFDLSAKRVLEEACLIAFSDLRDYVIDEAGQIAVAEGAPDAVMRAVKKVKRKRREIPHGKDAVIVEYESEIELWSKDTQLGHLMTHLGLLREPKEGEKPGEQLTRAEREQRVRDIIRAGAARVKELGKA